MGVQIKGRVLNLGSHRNRARKRDGIKRLDTLRQHLSQLLQERSNLYSPDAKRSLEEEISKTQQDIGHLSMLLKHNGTFILPVEIKPSKRKIVPLDTSIRCRKVTPEWEKPSSTRVYFEQKCK